MFIEDETGGGQKLDNFPKDRATLSMIRPLAGLSLGMMVQVQERVVCSSHGSFTTTPPLPSGVYPYQKDSLAILI